MLSGFEKRSMTARFHEFVMLFGVDSSDKHKGPALIVHGLVIARTVPQNRGHAENRIETEQIK